MVDSRRPRSGVVAGTPRLGQHAPPDRGRAITAG